MQTMGQLTRRDVLTGAATVAAATVLPVSIEVMTDPDPDALMNAAMLKLPEARARARAYLEALNAMTEQALASES